MPTLVYRVGRTVVEIQDMYRSVCRKCAPLQRLLVRKGLTHDKYRIRSPKRMVLIGNYTEHCTGGGRAIRRALTTCIPS